MLRGDSMSFLRGWWEIVAVLSLGVLTYATHSPWPLVPMAVLWIFATVGARRT